MHDVVIFQMDPGISFVLLEFASYVLAIASMRQFEEKSAKREWSSRKDFILAIIDRAIVIFLLNLIGVAFFEIGVNVESFAVFFRDVAISIIALSILSPFFAFPPDKAILGMHHHPPFGR